MNFEEEAAQLPPEALKRLKAAEDALKAAKDSGNAEAEANAQVEFDKESNLISQQIFEQLRTKILTNLAAAETALEEAKVTGDQEAETRAQAAFDEATKARRKFRKDVEEDFANKVNGLVSDLQAIMKKYKYT